MVGLFGRAGVGVGRESEQCRVDREHDRSMRSERTLHRTGTVLCYITSRWTVRTERIKKRVVGGAGWQDGSRIKVL